MERWVIILSIILSILVGLQSRMATKRGNRAQQIQNPNGSNQYQGDETRIEGTCLRAVRWAGKGNGKQKKKQNKTENKS